jgi:hypothetical protein
MKNTLINPSPFCVIVFPARVAIFLLAKFPSREARKVCIVSSNVELSTGWILLISSNKSWNLRYEGKRN